MAYDKNPLTGSTNVDSLELPDGFIIFMDKDSGLVYGDSELPNGIKADALFESRYGMPRPEDYKSDLQEIADQYVDDDSRVPDLHVESAKAVLEGTMQVFVTTAKTRDLKRELGLNPNQSASVGAVRLTDANINVGELGSGPSVNKDLQQSGEDTALAARVIAEARSAAARATSDKTLSPTVETGQAEPLSLPTDVLPTDLQQSGEDTALAARSGAELTEDTELTAGAEFTGAEILDTQAGAGGVNDQHD